MDIQTIIEQLKTLKPEAIILFGSAARGTMHPDSDVDLLLIQQTKKPFFERIRDARLAVRTSVPLDILVLTPEEVKTLPTDDQFFADIINEGKLIYGNI